MKLSPTEAELAEREGAHFTGTRDPSDPRFELVTWRRIAAEALGGPSLPDVDVKGFQARAKALKFLLGSVCGFARSLHEEQLARGCERLAQRLDLVTSRRIS